MGQPTVIILDEQRPISTLQAEHVNELWRAEEAVIDDVAQRLSEVRALAYAEDVLIAVGSLHLMNHNATGKPVYACAAIVSSEFRSQGLATDIYQSIIESAEEQFDAGTDTSAIGIFIEWQAAVARTWEETICSFSFEHSKQQRPMQLNLTGITEDGLPQYVYYFKNASLFTKGPVFEDERNLESGQSATSDFSFCWQSLTHQEQEAVTDLWLSHGVIKDRESCQRRLPDVAGLARIGEKIVGIASVFKAPYEPANAMFMGYRSFVSPDARGGFTATRLLKHTYSEFNRIYGESNTIDNMHGMAYVLQNDKLNRSVHKPMGPDVGSFLIGYINDMQMRVKYFDGAKARLHRGTSN